MSRIEEILEQVAYLADEIDAQQAVAGLIPDVVWDATPPGDERSLRQMYAAILRRDCVGNRQRMGLEPLEVPDTASPVDLLKAIAAARRTLVADLAAKHPDEEAAFAVTQQDADALREIALRLHETSMGTPHIRSL